MSFGDVVRSATVPGAPDKVPYGAGGKADVIYLSDADPTRLVHELSTTDLSSTKSAAPPSSHLYAGIGGTTKKIWWCDQTNIYELSTTDFSSVRSVAEPGDDGDAIGGDDDTIWHHDWRSDLAYELSTTDFSVIRSASVLALGTGAGGIGGTVDVIWYTNMTTDYVCELSVFDFSALQTASSPSGAPAGIGGDSGAIWHTDTGTDRIYELDSTIRYDTVYPTGLATTMTRVSSIRHIFRPGMFRMQVGLGDLGLDIDIAESSVRRELETARAPEPLEPLEPKPYEPEPIVFEPYEPAEIFPYVSAKVTAPWVAPEEPSWWQRLWRAITPWED